jgi:TonB-dependent SusC/RagA subfamily outer membrane receptor
MKKIYTISVFILLCVQWSHAQYKYDKKWDKVEKLELKEKYASANRIVDRIYKQADKEQNTAQIVKSLIYLSKFSLLISEDAEVDILQKLEQEIDKQSFPTNAVLENVYADFLSQYFSKYEYRIRSRSEISSDSIPKDIRKWNTKTFVAEIHKRFQHSITKEKELAQLPVEAYSDMLSGKMNTKKHRSNLYAILLYNTLDFYQKDIPYRYRRDSQYKFNAQDLAATEVFTKHTFDVDSIDEMSSSNVMHIFQKLERNYQDQKEVLVEIILQRLRYVFSKLNAKEGYALYRDALSKLINRYKNDPMEALIQYELASHCMEFSRNYYASTIENYPQLRTDALKITQQMIAKYPNSEGSIKCELLQKNILKKDISFKVEAFSVPNTPELCKIELRNIDTLYFKAYRIPHSYLQQRSYSSRDSLIRNHINTHSATYTKRYVVDMPKDHYTYTTEIMLPELPKGRYLISISDKVTEANASSFIYSVIQKTNLAEIVTELDTEKVHTIVNRATGKPIHNAVVKVFDKNNIINQIARTDVYGNARIRKREGDRNIEKYILFENDTLYTKKSSLGFDSGLEGDFEDIQARTFVFTDRSIYRPGQTIYFKGILIQKKDGVSSVVPNVFCEVILKDDDYKTIKKLRLKTNEFGSFSDAIVIPKNVLTGDFQISIEEDDDYEEDEHPFWDMIDDFESGEYHFKVEEYKRPRFEINVKQLTKNIDFNEEVNLTGNAKALLGSPVSNATVNYRVTRNASLKRSKLAIYKEEEKIKTIAETTTTTDAKGDFSISFITKKNNEIPLKDIYQYIYKIDVEVIDINGETQTITKNIYVDNEGFNISLQTLSKIEQSNPLAIFLETKDTNDVPVNVVGTVHIYKLKSPSRVFRKRPWDIPEIQTIQKEKFIEKFPHTMYDKEDRVKAKDKEKLVRSLPFNTKEGTAQLFVDVSTWKTGNYFIETVAYDERLQDSTRVTKKILLTNKNDQYLADNKLFEYAKLNSDYKKDGFVKLKLSTALRDEPLDVLLYVYHKHKLIRTQKATIEKGSKIVKIPVDSNLTDRISIRMVFVKFNGFYENDFSFKLYEDNKLLNIETTTFRNRLRPGEKEIWRFKIFDTQNQASVSEVLASMYDASLDQFNRHQWDTDLDYFYNRYTSTPKIRTTYFDTTRSKEIINDFRRYSKIPSFRDYLRFNKFGLDFVNINSEQYNYLKDLRERKKIQYTPFASGNITGHIVDESGMPLPGATIVIKGTDKGVASDFDGLFTINASSEDTLIFSYVGHITQEVRIGPRKNINVILEPSDDLEEVSVVAYGISLSKIQGVTVNVNGVKNTVPTGSLDQILRGQAAGVSVNTGSGALGNSGVIVIRGTNSLTTDGEPLIIVDGVPVDTNAFKNLDQSNMASVSVLKDTAATALYGNRSANGVIIVSTKYGTKTELIDGKKVIVGLTETDLDNIETRKNLKETAFFFPHLRTDAEGNVAVEFEAPESLTQWKFQLFAHQKNNLFGSIEKNAVTQKELMVIPNMPRFLREKDTIVIATKIANLQTKATKGIASLRLFDAHTMESIDAKIHMEDKNKAFSVAAKGNTDVSWKLYIPEGYDAIQYRVIAKAGNFSDGEESALPVLKNKILITEAKPFWVKAGASAEVTFEKLAEQKSTSLEQHQLILEYTSNPAWTAIQSLPYLLEYPYECTEQTFSRLYANMLATHIVQSSPKIKEVFESWKANGQLVSDLEKNPELKTLMIAETPWARDAASETEKKQRLAQLFDAATLQTMEQEMWIKLEDLQKVSGGFPWFAGGNENPYITLHILQMYAHLVQLNIITDQNKKGLYNIMEMAYQYADKRFLEAYTELQEKPSDQKYRQQIRYIYTRSMIGDFITLPKEVKAALKAYLNILQKDWLLVSLEEKAMIALSLARMGNRKAAKKIVASLKESAVMSAENGMYWRALADKKYKAYAIETHALLIEAFAEIDNNKKVLQELQLWLLQQKQVNNWATTKATTKAIYALLIRPTPFVSIKDNTVFTIGNEKIKSARLDENTKEALTGYFKTSWQKAEVTPKKATINIQNKGKVTGYGAAYWQYFETLENVQQNDEADVQVSKELYRSKVVDGKKTLTPISKNSLKIGDVITVRLTIENKKEVSFIHLKDMRAAGLEPVNVLSEYKWQDGIGYYESTRDASSNFFFDRIPEGVFILEYELRVNNTGEFSNGITTIESMYAPELRSHTKGIRLKID